MLNMLLHHFVKVMLFQCPVRATCTSTCTCTCTCICTCVHVFNNKLPRYKILLAFNIKWQNLKFASKGLLKGYSHLIKPY